MTFRTRSTLCAVAAALVVAAGAAGVARESSFDRLAAGAEPPAQAMTEARVLSTITATLSGTERTWQVVAGPSRGRAYSSASWRDVGEGRRTITLLGFDTARLPLESFEWGVDGLPTSLGSYAGTTMLLSLTVGAASAPFRLIYPPETVPVVTYASRTTRNPRYFTFIISQGTVDVTTVSFAGGLASVAGTFGGELRHGMGTGTLEISAGAFDVAAIPNAAVLK